MVELIEIHPEIAVQESEYKRLLGFPANYALEGRVRELADAAREWYLQNGRPWIYARETEDFKLGSGSLSVNGAEFMSKRLHGQLLQAEAHQGVVVAVSAGGQCEERAHQLWEEGKPDEYFFMEIFGSAVVEHLVTVAGAHLCAWADGHGMAVLPHYSPGYSGWDMADQIKLFDLLQPKNVNGFPGEINIRESGMLQPKKSLLALFGVTRRLDRVRSIAELVPCENCSFPSCKYRRVPFVQSLPQLEDVARLGPALRTARLTGAGNRSVLNHAAKYSVNLRALRKWSQERLKLTHREDGSVEARFHYEGTTCSNMGLPLEFDYQVKLGPAAGRFQILQADCTPSDGDTGHTQMCAYLSDSKKLMGAIAEEKPLLGRPLAEVLEWRRPSIPSGCYCEFDARLHKWGLVLEVLHYALVEHEKAMAGSGGQKAGNQHDQNL
jgi:hypothetical protein